MTHLIDKDALVAEIERLQDSIKATAIDGRISKEQAEVYKVCVKLRSFIEDTLGVKEIDLEKEIRDYLDKQRIVTRKCIDYKIVPSPEVIAKHFFELGLKYKKRILENS